MLIFIIRWMLGEILWIYIISTYAPVAQLDRALACGAKGRRFKSCRAYQDKNSTFVEFLSCIERVPRQE